MTADDELVEYLVADESRMFFPPLGFGELAAAVDEFARAEMHEGGGIGGGGRIEGNAGSRGGDLSNRFHADKEAVE
jgi:hypothetical protein